MLTIGARVDRTGGGDQVAGTGKRMRAQLALDVDHRDPRRRDPLVAEEDEMGVTVAVRIDALDVEDRAGGGGAVSGSGLTGRRPGAERDRGGDGGR